MEAQKIKEMQDKKKWSEEAERQNRRRGKDEFAAEQQKMQKARQSKEEWTKYTRAN